MAQEALDAAVSRSAEQDQLTAELTRIGKERDEAVNRAVSADDFLAYISHEMRTPMNGIIGITDLMLAGDLSDEQREHLSMVRSSSDVLLTLVNDLLDHAKIQANRLEIEHIRFDMRSAIRHALGPLDVQASAKGITLTTQIDDSIAEQVIGDPGRLRQVLVNLVSNAIKFTDVGSVTVTVGELASDDTTCVIGFAVSDTGVGIPTHRLESIFDAFTQAEPSTTRRFGGTGLGLAIANRLVALMGGEIIVDSTLGTGSVFRFSVPLAIAHAEEPHPVPATDDDLPRVLVVTDHTANGTAIEVAATHSNFSIDVVDDVYIGIDRLRRAHIGGMPYAVAAIDLAQNVIETTAMLVQRSAVPALQVIVVTPTGQRGDAAACRSAGIAGYLTGGLTPSELLGAIDGTLSGTGDLVTRHWLRERLPPPLHILVVDDSPTNRVVAQRILERAGHTVVTAASGEDAVAMVKTVRFDAILMDVEMPGIDGFTAAGLIRSVDGYASVPIMALTSHAGDDFGASAVNAGMNGVIVKPFSASLLVTEVESAARLRV